MQARHAQNVIAGVSYHSLDLQKKPILATYSRCAKEGELSDGTLSQSCDLPKTMRLDNAFLEGC